MMSSGQSRAWGLGMEHAWHAEGEEGMRAEGPAHKDPKCPAKGHEPPRQERL